MTERPPRGTNPGKPSRIDTSTAHSARIYNYWHPERIVTRLMSALPAGSYLVLSHPARDVQPAAMAEMTRRGNERMRGAMATLRTRDEVARFFGGLRMIEPGVVQPQRWRPDPVTEKPEEVTAWCGMALKS